MKISQLSLMPEGSGKAAQAAGAGRSVRVADARQAAQRSDGQQVCRARKPIAPRETDRPGQFRGAGRRSCAGVCTLAGRQAGPGDRGRARRPRRRAAHAAGQPPGAVRAARARSRCPADKRTRLVLERFARTERGWNLTVNADGKRLHQSRSAARRRRGRLADDLARSGRAGRASK